MNSSLSGIKKGPDETLSIPSFHVDSSALMNRVINTKINQVKDYLNTELTNINYSLSKYVKETKIEADSVKNHTDRVNSINVKIINLEERVETNFHKMATAINSLVDRVENLNRDYQKKLTTEIENILIEPKTIIEDEMNIEPSSLEMDAELLIE